MYYTAKENYVYKRYDRYCGSPVREIKRCTDAEAKAWDRLEKACREASKR